jgi:hypothetical protein
MPGGAAVDAEAGSELGGGEALVDIEVDQLLAARAAAAGVVGLDWDAVADDLANRGLPHAQSPGHLADGQLFAHVKLLQHLTADPFRPLGLGPAAPARRLGAGVLEGPPERGLVDAVPIGQCSGGQTLLLVEAAQLAGVGELAPPAPSQGDAGPDEHGLGAVPGGAETTGDLGDAEALGHVEPLQALLITGTGRREGRPAAPAPRGGGLHGHDAMRGFWQSPPASTEMAASSKGTETVRVKPRVW